jgi:hypothetical protein
MHESFPHVKPSDVQVLKKKMEVGAESGAHQHTSAIVFAEKSRKMRQDQAADRVAISMVRMVLSPVVVDGTASVPAGDAGVKCRAFFRC